eukprot:3176755-Alexandrium_andersonii.AAC.3
MAHGLPEQGKCSMRMACDGRLGLLMPGQCSKQHLPLSSQVGETAAAASQTACGMSQQEDKSNDA